MPTPTSASSCKPISPRRSASPCLTSSSSTSPQGSPSASPISPRWRASSSSTTSASWLASRRRRRSRTHSTPSTAKRSIATSDAPSRRRECSTGASRARSCCGCTTASHRSGHRLQSPPDDVEHDVPVALGAELTGGAVRVPLQLGETLRGGARDRLGEGLGRELVRDDAAVPFPHDPLHLGGVTDRRCDPRLDVLEELVRQRELLVG